MSEYDLLVAAIENYGSTCLSLGASAITNTDYKDLKERRAQDFHKTLAAIAKYQHSLLKPRENRYDI